MTPYNGRVAHVSLKGKVEAERFVKGKVYRVNPSVTPLLTGPDGARTRELLMGDAFLVIQHVPNYASFGVAERDGYCGWVNSTHLVQGDAPTHVVNIRETYLSTSPDLKSATVIRMLSHGAKLIVSGTIGDWSELRAFALSIGTPVPPDFPEPPKFYLPSAHLAPVGTFETDPVDVARRFLGTPYLWGGNSGRGIDCSGLIQAAMLACGWACPGDSDLQEAMPGQHLADTNPLQPGDLLFWKGHVAMVTGPDTMIHANAHHMMTVEEPIAPAIARIAATDTGPVTSRLRPERRPLTSFF